MRCAPKAIIPIREARKTRHSSAYALTQKNKAPEFSLRRLLCLPERRSCQIETIRVHNLRPHRHEVFHELFLRVSARVDFREGAELRVRTEDEVDACSSPLDRIRLAVAAFVQVSASR